MFLGVNSSIFVVVLLLSKTTSLELLFTFACCYHYLYCFFKGLLIGILDCVCACGGGGGGLYCKVIFQTDCSILRPLSYNTGHKLNNQACETSRLVTLLAWT